MASSQPSDELPPKVPVLTEDVLQSLQRAVASSSRLGLATAGPQITFRLVREIGRKSSPTLARPITLALDAEGGILVLDRPAPDRFRLARFTQAGEADSIITEFHKGGGDPELLDPVGLAVDGHQQFYIPDSQAGCVKKFSLDGRWLSTVFSAGPSGNPFCAPRDVDVDGTGNLYIADTNNNRIVKLRPDGELDWVLEQFCIGQGSQEPDEFYEPCSICVGKDSVICVADTNQNRVLSFDRDRRVLVTLSGDDLFEFPTEVRLSKDGSTIYVADRGNLRVQRFDQAGKVTGYLMISQGLAEGSDICGGGDIDVNEQGHVVMINPVRESVVVLDFVER